MSGYVLAADRDLDLGETLRALQQAGYEGMAAVELSRDSHRGIDAAREALGLLVKSLACET